MSKKTEIVQWQYKVLWLNLGEIETVLNSHGAVGWELSSIMKDSIAPGQSNYCVVFKYPTVAQ